MKKQFPLKSYFNRARIFGYVLILIVVIIAGYLLVTFFNG